MARQAIERALAGDDPGAALFVLEEEARRRDPCVTLADSVLRSRKRALASTAPPAPPPADAAARPGRYRYDPLRRMMNRGAARLRQDIVAEDVLRHAALQAVAPAPVAAPLTGAAATRAAAERALALKRSAATLALPLPEPAPVMLHQGISLRDGVLEPLTPPRPASPAVRGRRSRTDPAFSPTTSPPAFTLCRHPPSDQDAGRWLACRAHANRRPAVLVWTAGDGGA